MPVVILVAVVGALALGAVALVPKLIQENAKNKTAARCAELEARLAGVRVQGGNIVEARRLENEIRACYDEARAMGIDVDPTATTLSSCDLAASQLGAEWQNYLSTALEDAVGRNDKRQAVLRIGGEMVQCYRRAVAEAADETRLNAIKRSVEEQILQSKMRIQCLLNGTGACSRYGLNEAHVNDRATDEMMRIGAPLGIIRVYGERWDGAPGNFIAPSGDLETSLRMLREADAGSVLAEIEARRAAVKPATAATLDATTAAAIGSRVAGLRFRV